MSIDRHQAEQIILEMLNRDPQGERFVIGSCELSPRGDCWVITANSAAYLEEGDLGAMYVGVNAYLVDCENGGVEIVGSGEQVEDVLQDRYDRLDAGGRHYVLRCAIGRDDKPGLIRIHRVLGCSLTEARLLVSDSGRGWLLGRRRALQQAQSLLDEQGLEADIVLLNEPLTAVEIEEPPWNLSELRALLRKRLDALETEQAGGSDGD